MSAPLVLVSHALCPYVQRAAIVLREKGVPFERRDIDLANKPDWFLRISPWVRHRCCWWATRPSLNPL